MKKLISMFSMILTVFLINSSAYAEFELRNGILFGDTIDQIVEKETTLVRQSEDSNWFDGKIAGYENATCGFYFDDNQQLNAMDYSFGSMICTSRDETNNVYKKLYESLCRKYGNAIGNVGGTIELITGPAFEKSALIVYLFGSLDGYSGDYVDYDEWTVDEDDYHVKIDLVSYFYRDDKYKYHYSVDVSYKKYTDEEFFDAVKEKQGEREEVDNDL